MEWGLSRNGMGEGHYTLYIQSIDKGVAKALL